MQLLSMVLEVYNEEKCLPYCLDSTLPFVDEAIIIHGSENGLSTDRTMEIINEAIRKYPEKIKYVEGVFKRDDGAWDDTAQSNEGFKRVTSKFVMRTHADIIYDNMAQLRDIVEYFQDTKKVFYCPMIEFFYDTKHIRLGAGTLSERLLPRPMIGDLPVISMELNPHFEDIGEYRRSSLILENFNFQRDALLYMPHVKRFHFGWVKPFKDQVLKHVRYIMRGDHEAEGEKLKSKGEKAVFSWAIEHVLSYKNDPSMFSYGGEYPAIIEPLRDMTSMEGYDDFMEWYRERERYEDMAQNF